MTNKLLLDTKVNKQLMELIEQENDIRLLFEDSLKMRETWGRQTNTIKLDKIIFGQKQGMATELLDSFSYVAQISSHMEDSTNPYAFYSAFFKSWSVLESQFQLLFSSFTIMYSVPQFESKFLKGKEQRFAIHLKTLP